MKPGLLQHPTQGRYVEVLASILMALSAPVVFAADGFNAGFATTDITLLVERWTEVIVKAHSVLQPATLSVVVPQQPENPATKQDCS